MTVVMHDILQFDDVNLDLIPANATHVAAYVDGRFANYTEAVQRFPHAVVLPIAVSSSTDAHALHVKEVVLDDEPGDATNATAPGWTKRQQQLGRLPIEYTSASNIAALVSALAAAGISRDKYLIWSAHFTGIPHICGPKTCGFPQADGTQYTDHALGRSLDESLMSEAFFPTDPPPAPKPDTGTAHATVTYHLGRKDNLFEVHGTAGSAHFSGPDKWVGARLEVNLKTGAWRIHRL